jgi:hypothetical protein
VSAQSPAPVQRAPVRIAPALPPERPN